MMANGGHIRHLECPCSKNILCKDDTTPANGVLMISPQTFVNPITHLIAFNLPFYPSTAGFIIGFYIYSLDENNIFILFAVAHFANYKIPLSSLLFQAFLELNTWDSIFSYNVHLEQNLKHKTGNRPTMPVPIIMPV